MSDEHPFDDETDDRGSGPEWKFAFMAVVLVIVWLIFLNPLSG